MSHIIRSLFVIYNKILSDLEERQQIPHLLSLIDKCYVHKIYHEVWRLSGKPDVDEFGRDYFNIQIIDNEYDKYTKVCATAVYNVLCDYIVEMNQCCFCSFKLMNNHMVYHDDQLCIYLMFTKNKHVFVITPIEHVEIIEDFMTGSYSNLLTDSLKHHKLSQLSL